MYYQDDAPNVDAVMKHVLSGETGMSFARLM